MRKDRSFSPAVSAALLALTVTVCTGSLADGATARLLFAPGRESGAMVDHGGDAMGSLLAHLSAAARQLYQAPGQSVAARLTPTGRAALAATLVTGLGGGVQWVFVRPPIQAPVHLSLLNLPPPLPAA